MTYENEMLLQYLCTREHNFMVYINYFCIVRSKHVQWSDPTILGYYPVYAYV